MKHNPIIMDFINDANDGVKYENIHKKYLI